jgi:quinol monooxygenase YgiN
MIRHIVMWQLHEPTDAPEFKALLDTCQALLPGILEWEVGIRTAGLAGSMDVALVSTFQNRAALQAYHEHPHYKAVSVQLGRLCARQDVIDFPTEALATADVDLASDLSFAPTAPGELPSGPE